MALISLLSNQLKDVKDVAKYSHQALTLPDNSLRLRTLITKLVDCAYAGEVLTVKSVSSSSTGIKDTSAINMSIMSKSNNFITPSNEIIPEEDEDETGLNLVTKQFIEDSTNNNS